MNRLHTAAVLLVLAAVHSSLAGITISVVPVSINQNAISGPAGDPALAGFRAFDIRADYPAGDSFNVAGLFANLSQGQFYAPEFGGVFPQSPALFAFYPAVEYDTYITFPGYGTHSAYGTPGRLYGTGAAIMPVFGGQDTLMNIVWGRHGTPHAPSGIHTIARLTVSPHAVGVLDGVVLGHNNPNVNSPFSAEISGGEIVNLRVGVPEPASVLILLPALAIRRRRPRR